MDWNWQCLSVVLVEVIIKIIVIEEENSILISVSLLGNMVA